MVWLVNITLAFGTYKNAVTEQQQIKPSNVLFIILCILMDISVQFDTIRLGWYIIQLKGSQVGTPKLYYISVPEDPFIIANSADPDEIPHFVVSHLSLHYLSVYQTTVVQYTKGKVM